MTFPVETDQNWIADRETTIESQRKSAGGRSELGESEYCRGRFAQSGGESGCEKEVILFFAVKLCLFFSPFDCSPMQAK